MFDASGLLPNVTYTLDGAGRIYGAKDATNTDLTSASYDAMGHVTGIVFGSGDSDTYTYDANTGRMKTYTFNVNGSKDTGTLTWNPNGTLQQLAINDQLNSADTQTCNYLYSALMRLTKVDCGTTWGQTFGFDAYGNLSKYVISGDAGLTWYPGYDNNNHYTLTGTSYDNDGNLKNDSFNDYTWSPLFTGPVTINGDTVVYDAFNRIVEQQSGSSYTEFLYSPSGAKLAAMQGQHALKAFIPLPAGAVAAYGGTTLQNFYHADWLGTVRVSSSTSRSLTYDVAYAPFGERYAMSGSAAYYTFTGQMRNHYVDNLWDFPMREYHNNQGRWISPDPAGLAAVDPASPQTWNRYTYAGNNPLSFVDPLGLRKCLDLEGNPVDCTNNSDPNQSEPAQSDNEPHVVDAIPSPADNPGCGVWLGMLHLSFFVCPVLPVQSSGGGGRKPYVTPGAVPARQVLITILSGENQCSDFFNLGAKRFPGAPSAADLFGATDIRLNPGPATLGAQSFEGAGASDPIFINPNGPFFPPMPGTPSYSIGPYPSGSLKAQVTILAHEHGHTTNVLPPDGAPLNGLGPDGNVGMSLANTNLVLMNCGSEINAVP